MGGGALKGVEREKKTDETAFVAASAQTLNKKPPNNPTTLSENLAQTGKGPRLPMERLRATRTCGSPRSASSFLTPTPSFRGNEDVEMKP